MPFSPSYPGLFLRTWHYLLLNRNHPNKWFIKYDPAGSIWYVDTVFGISNKHAVCRAVTDLVPELIWAHDFFGPQEIWALRNLDPRKFGPQEIWAPKILPNMKEIKLELGYLNNCTSG